MSTLGVGKYPIKRKTHIFVISKNPSGGTYASLPHTVALALRPHTHEALDGGERARGWINLLIDYSIPTYKGTAGSVIECLLKYLY